jgi:hypothetical protein
MEKQKHPRVLWSKVFARRRVLKTLLFSWLVLLSVAVAALLWWQNVEQKFRTADEANLLRLMISSGINNVYERPIVSAERKLTIFPDAKLALSYRQDIGDVRYNFVDFGPGGQLYEVDLTNSIIMNASAQAQDYGPHKDGPNFPVYLGCQQVLRVMGKADSGKAQPLATVKLTDGRTLFAYPAANDPKRCVNAYVYEADTVKKFADWLKTAQVYNL